MKIKDYFNIIFNTFKNRRNWNKKSLSLTDCLPCLWGNLEEREEELKKFKKEVEFLIK